jgi:hypothetical protein
LTTLRGTGQGNTAVYGRAAVVSDETGRPTLDADLLAAAARIARREDDTLSVILVAPDPIQALLMPLPPGLTISGIVAEASPNRPLPPDTPPLVYGVEGARASVAEGLLLLVDPARGRVLIEPDAREVARLQTGAFRSRVLVGAAHTPAVTMSGREVAVRAAVRYFSEAEDAVAEGAEGLYVEPFGDILDDTESDAMLTRLRRLAEIIGAGPILLTGGITAYDSSTLVRAAAFCRLAVITFPDDLPLPLAEVRAEFDRMVQEERDEEHDAARPSFIASVSDPAIASDAAAFDGLVIDSTVLAGLTPEVVFGLPPVYLLATDGIEALPSAVTLGIAGVIVAPDTVAAAKDLIRAQE